MSKVDVNVVGGAVPFSTGKETTTGRVKNANSVFKSYVLKKKNKKRKISKII